MCVARRQLPIKVCGDCKYINKCASGGSWHRDANFSPFKAMFYFTVACEAEDGAFQFAPRPNRTSTILQDSFTNNRTITNTRWTEDEVAKRYSTYSIASALGQAGTLVLFDTSPLHHGDSNHNASQSEYAMTNYYPTYMKIHNVYEQSERLRFPQIYFSFGGRLRNFDY